jgi:hypothetical protein
LSSNLPGRAKKLRPIRLLLCATTLLLLLASACGGDEGAEVRNIGESEGATNTAVGGSSSGSASGSAAASGSGSGSSSEAAETPAFTETEADTKLDYNLVDYKFEGPAEAKGPKVFFTARNTGKENHELEVLDPAGEALGEIAEFAPNAGADPIALELAPGTYTLQCILETADGKVHKDLGMELKLTVT